MTKKIHSQLTIYPNPYSATYQICSSGAIPAKEIKEAMKWSGLNQPQLAKKLNVTQQTISKYISGKALPTFDVFANLCVVLDLDANEVLNIITERKNAK